MYARSVKPGDVMKAKTLLISGPGSVFLQYGTLANYLRSSPSVSLSVKQHKQQNLSHVQEYCVGIKRYTQTAYLTHCDHSNLKRPWKKSRMWSKSYLLSEHRKHRVLLLPLLFKLFWNLEKEGDILLLFKRRANPDTKI